MHCVRVRTVCACEHKCACVCRHMCLHTWWEEAVAGKGGGGREKNSPVITDTEFCTSDFRLRLHIPGAGLRWGLRAGNDHIWCFVLMRGKFFAQGSSPLGVCPPLWVTGNSETQSPESSSNPICMRNPMWFFVVILLLFVLFFRP